MLLPRARFQVAISCVTSEWGSVLTVATVANAREEESIILVPGSLYASMVVLLPHARQKGQEMNLSTPTAMPGVQLAIG